MAQAVIESWDFVGRGSYLLSVLFFAEGEEGQTEVAVHRDRGIWRVQGRDLGVVRAKQIRLRYPGISDEIIQTIALIAIAFAEDCLT